MKVALAQINTTIGAFDANLAKIRASLDSAQAQGVELVVFPEQVICGYPAEDLLEREDFLRAIDTCFQSVVEACRGVAMVIGTVLPAAVEGGNPIYNSAVLVENGKILGVQHKTLLPTYDVFDELRYFRPATEHRAFEFHGHRLGLLVCEDLWNDSEFWQSRRYALDPVEKLVREQGVDTVVAISASPFSVGRSRFRRSMLQSSASRHGINLVYCNSVGGNTSLVFDGASFLMDARGELLSRAAKFEEDFVVADLPAIQARQKVDRAAKRPASTSGLKPRVLSESDLQDVYSALVLGTRDYLHKSGFQRAVVGLSGGIDSALTAAVAVEALGPENVTGVAMPSRYSSEGSVKDAEALANNLGIQLHQVPIEGMFDAALKTLAPIFEGLPQDVTEENLQARIRGQILMAFSNKFGALLLTTGNKSELAVGYCTLYGDMSGGLAVISDVPKLLVFDLCRWLNRSREVIPEATIEKPPSAELRPDQKDQDSLPAYEILDPILEAYVEDRAQKTDIVAMGYDAALVEKIIRLVDLNEYKRKQAAPGIRITTKAFGRGRRLPIVERFNK